MKALACRRVNHPQETVTVSNVLDCCNSESCVPHSAHASSGGATTRWALQETQNRITLRESIGLTDFGEC